MKKLNFLLIIFTLVILSSCKKDDDSGNDSNLYKNGVFIVNEGQFMEGNSSVSFYNPSTKTYVDNIFELVNNRPLGDIAQSIYLHNNRAYIVVNNSGKIEVVDAETFESLGTIQNLTSPRYFLPVGNNKAYVTDLFSNTISVINLNNYTVESTITTNGFTEEMIAHNGKVFVGNKGTGYVYVINPSNHSITDSIALTEGAGSLVVDKNNKIWVLCEGKSWEGIAGALYRINPQDLSIEATFNFSETEFASRLRINNAGDKLFYLNNGVVSMDINASSVPASAFIPQGDKFFHGLRINPANNEIYTSDALDFVQRGIVYRYSSDGNLIDEFTSGIIPGEFTFN
jgi:YVTN family beta-propeller protein